MWRHVLAWALAGFFAVWALIRVFGLDHGYPLVPVIAFTPYVALLSVLAVGVVAVLRTRGALVLAAASAVVLVSLVMPRAFGGGGAAAPVDGEPLTVMTANLRFGAADAERVVELVRENGVELLSVQELTPPSVRRLHAAGLDELLDEHVLSAEPGASGTGLYATAPLESTGLIESGIGFGMQGGRMQIGDRTVEVVSVHPVPPTSSTTVERWRNALRALPSAGGEDSIGLLAGDFNATLDHDELRDVLDRGYVDAADVTGHALTTTWSRSLSPALTIDHILADDRVHIESTSIHDLPGSDHRAVIAELVLPATP